MYSTILLELNSTHFICPNWYQKQKQRRAEYFILADSCQGIKINHCCPSASTIPHFNSDDEFCKQVVFQTRIMDFKPAALGETRTL